MYTLILLLCGVGFFCLYNTSRKAKLSTKGKWETFTVPLKSWGNLDGLAFSNPIVMEFMLKDANPSQSDFAICNFRMVPIK